MGVYLVTGGAGFIGSNLIATLLDQGHVVHALDLHEPPPELLHPKLTWFQGDLLDSTIVNSSIQGVDAVVHLAAQTSVPISMAHPERTHEVNVRGTEILIEICQRHGVGRLLSASSAAVYGDCRSLPLTEEKAGILLSPYAESKWANEKQLLDAKNDGLDAIAMRFFNVYGNHVSKGKNVGGVISAFIRAMITESPLQIHGDGLQTRDFVHVGDVADAIVSLLTMKPRYTVHAVNVCNGIQTSLVELVGMIEQELRRQSRLSEPVSPFFSESLSGDIQHSLGSPSLLQSLIDWHPKYTLQGGIEKIITSMEERP
jgi:nucleoside-diphosphate-sugar epimerase